jgi:CBS domain-containing protein
MDISDVVTAEFGSFDPAARVAKLVGAFTERDARAVVVESDDGVAGVVTRRQLLASKHDPDERVDSVMRDDPPRIDRTEDVRETARLMVESELRLLPVFEGEQFAGVVTARDLIAAVQPNLDALDVDDVYTQDLITIEPETTVGQVINTVREQGISRVPVVDETDTGGGVRREALGMVSLYDLVEFVVRSTRQEQGGDAGGFDGHAGAGSADQYRTHRGHGERAGEEIPLLDLPARDVMNVPATTVTPATSLSAAADEMLTNGYASLIVVDGDDQPIGILTLSDLLRSLTWTDEEQFRSQIFGVDLLTGISREEVADLVAAVDAKYAEMDLIEAYVVLQDHTERLRGTPLIRATIRLFTNKGRFAGTGEEYGAAPAIRGARDNLERNVLDDKEYADSKKRSPGDREQAQRLLGWWLEA